MGNPVHNVKGDYETIESNGIIELQEFHSIIFRQPAQRR
jgi:hypothetical protein